MSLEAVYLEEGPESEDTEDDEEEAVLLHVESVKEECEGTEASEAGVLAGLYTSHTLEEDVVLEPEHQPDALAHAMVMEPRARASSKQYATLIGFMERHSDIARLPPGSRLWGDRLWQQLVTSLNSMPGGVYKPLEKWKKVWADWKTKTKKKAFILRKSNAAKGSLNVLEMRVLGVMKPAAYRMADLDEKGFRQTPSRPSPQPKADNVAHGVTGERSEDANAGDAYSTASLGAPPAPHPRHLRPPAPHPGHPRPAPDTPNAANSLESITNASTLGSLPPTTHHSSTTSAPTANSSTATSHPPTTSPPTATSPPANRHSLRTRVTLAEALNNFVSIERRRLKLEEVRERNLHMRERERLRLERERLRVERERVDVFRHLAEMGQDLLAHFTGGSHNHAHD